MLAKKGWKLIARLQGPGSEGSVDVTDVGLSSVYRFRTVELVVCLQSSF